MRAFKPVILHYHLFPGGVSVLILNSLIPLIRKGFIEDGIKFVLGSEERSEWFFDRLRAAVPSGFKIERQVIPEINYWDPSYGEVDRAAETIRTGLLAFAGPDEILWAHNPTLGKNPAYLLALKRIARDDPDRRIFMHVHDSAEQGRWPNLGLMRASLPGPYYFVSPGTRWLLINRSDADAFSRCGMPDPYVRYFPDVIVPPPPETGTPQKTVLDTLSAFAGRNGFAMDLDRPRALFAGRTIRRKNLLEALLLCLCAPEPAALIVTLPSDSPDDKPYESMLVSQLRKHGAGIAGFGAELIGREFSLPSLSRACDTVLTSSVMEGFGLPYLEFPMFGRPLFARRISTMHDFDDIAHALPHHYYRAFFVPLDKALKNYHKERYLEKIKILGQRFGLPGEIEGNLATHFESHFDGKTIDFSYLSASAQFSILDELTPQKTREIRAANKSLYVDFEKALKDQKRDPLETEKAVQSRFSTDIFQQNIEQILDSYNVAPLSPFSPGAFQEALLHHFFTPENLRLLFDYKPYLSTMI